MKCDAGCLTSSTIREGSLPLGGRCVLDEGQGEETMLDITVISALQENQFFQFLKNKQLLWFSAPHIYISPHPSEFQSCFHFTTSHVVRPAGRPSERSDLGVLPTWLFLGSARIIDGSPTTPPRDATTRRHATPQHDADASCATFATETTKQSVSAGGPA